MHFADKHSLGDIQLFPVTISRKEDLGQEAYIVYFKRFFDFNPGQVIAISMKKEEPPRLYSICSGPDEEEIGILFKVKPDGFLTPRLAALNIGEQMMVSKSFGTFYGTQNADYWIAAGTGIAPFVSMQKVGWGINKTLIHGGREASSFYYRDLFLKTQGLNYISCSSTQDGSDFYQGRLTEYLKKEELDINRTFFVCGSSEMVVQVRDILIDRGVDYDHIIAEIYF